MVDSTETQNAPSLFRAGCPVGCTALLRYALMLDVAIFKSGNSENVADLGEVVGHQSEIGKDSGAKGERATSS